eukprot:1362895-Rhodomonas_salina.3
MQDLSSSNLQHESLGVRLRAASDTEAGISLSITSIVPGLFHNNLHHQKWAEAPDNGATILETRATREFRREQGQAA